MKRNQLTLPQVVTWMNWLLASLPYLTLAGLWLMTLRAMVLIGKFPMVSWDDPKYIGSSDLMYQVFYYGTAYLIDFLFCSVWIWVPFTGLVLFLYYRVRDRINRAALRLLAPSLLYVVGFLWVLFDPAERFWWWMD